MAKSEPPPYRTVKTTNTVFSIVELLAEQNGATISAITNEVDLARSTVYEHLSTLEQMGYITKEGTVYHISLAFLQHGINARNRLKVYRVSQEPLANLAEQTGESAWLAVEENDEVVFIDKVLGDNVVRTEGEIGSRAPFYMWATGKAILAHKPWDYIESYSRNQDFKTKTKHTITDPDELLETCERIRDEGVAYNLEESDLGMSGIASPILCGDEVKGSIGVVGPKSRLPKDTLDEDIAPPLLNATNVVELHMNHLDISV
jgi:DNA-binding IclR family transcriptional regulator